MIALDDAAWAAPWRDVSVGQKVLLSLGLVATALTAPAWPTTILVAISAVTLALGFAKIPPRTLALAFTAPSAFDQLFSSDVTQDIAFGPLNLGLSQDKALKRVRGVIEQLSRAHLLQPWQLELSRRLGLGSRPVDMDEMVAALHAWRG